MVEREREEWEVEGWVRMRCLRVGLDRDDGVECWSIKPGKFIEAWTKAPH